MGGECVFGRMNGVEKDDVVVDLAIDEVMLFFV